MTPPTYHPAARLASRLHDAFRHVQAGLTSLLEIAILPARRAAPLQPRITDECLLRARLAASLGVRRQPQRPGLWLRTTREGTQRLYRVRDHNGRLYATVGSFAPMAVPTARMPGYWDLVA